MSHAPKMRWKGRLAAAGALCVVAGLAVSLRPPGRALAGTQPDSYPLAGIVRDFHPGHPDFGPGQSDSLTYSAGNVADALSTDGLPQYTGAGRAVLTAAHDAQGRGIRAGAATGHAVTNFSISGASVSCGEPAAAKVTFIGAGMVSSVGIAGRVNVGSTEYLPFGAFDMSVNLNGAAPISGVLAGTIAPGAPITVDGMSWYVSDGSPCMSVSSANGGRQVLALRDGDAAPTVAGFQGQVSAKAMLAPYLAADGSTVSLKLNQVIYLFELGVTDPSSSAFDMQDLVVLVDLASDPSYFDDPGTPTTGDCGTINDTPAVLGGNDGGGIGSPASFAQWFTDASGQNLSARRVINMTRDANGNYVFTSPNFNPINGELYGNQGANANLGFTFGVDADVAYSKCSGQFVEFSGDAEAWIFVDGKLALDMGGSHGTQSQVVDMDRLGITDGATARVKMFFAMRGSTAAFTLRTNAILSTKTRVDAPPVSGLYD